MKKYIIIALVGSFILMSCHQPKPEIPTQKTTADTLKKAIVNPLMEALQVSGLSSDELKDDSIFADGSVPTTWQIAGVTNVKGLKLFIKKLQQWIVTNDKDSLASVVKYPLNKTIKTKADLVEHYDALFTKDVKLSFATLNFSELFRNANGVMTTGGKVWFNQQAKKFYIIAINP